MNYITRDIDLLYLCMKDRLSSLDVHSSTSGSIVILPLVDRFLRGGINPQVNIRMYRGTLRSNGGPFEWQGYWFENRWQRPIGMLVDPENCNYVLPQSWGRASKPVSMLEFDIRRVLRMTRRWFEVHRQGPQQPGPIPVGSRLATQEEIDASE